VLLPQIAILVPLVKLANPHAHKPVLILPILPAEAVPRLIINSPVPAAAVLPPIRVRLQTALEQQVPVFAMEIRVKLKENIVQQTLVYKVGLVELLALKVAAMAVQGAIR
jgi:hypothetical protein